MARVPFALNPSQTTVGIIDFTRESNAKLYKQATTKLSEATSKALSEGIGIAQMLI